MKPVTRASQNGAIDEIPVKITSDSNYLEKYFAEKSRDLKFYDFPAFWNETLKKVDYVERLVVKRNYKYKTVRTNIRLTKAMEEIFIKGDQISQ